jgi:hypothetical protein
MIMESISTLVDSTEVKIIDEIDVLLIGTARLPGFGYVVMLHFCQLAPR